MHSCSNLNVNARKWAATTSGVFRLEMLENVDLPPPWLPCVQVLSFPASCRRCCQGLQHVFMKCSSMTLTCRVCLCVRHSRPVQSEAESLFVDWADDPSVFCLNNRNLMWPAGLWAAWCNCGRICKSIFIDWTRQLLLVQLYPAYPTRRLASLKGTGVVFFQYRSFCRISETRSK